jgi:glycyl-tRNA synthetase beta chain
MELLLEINTEEMPSSHVKMALDDLQAKFRKELAAAKLAVAGLSLYSTSRRLIVVGDIAERQEDREEIVTGPPKAVAFAADGTPTQAAQGFAKSKGIAVSDLQVVKTAKGEYLGFKKVVQGKSTAEIMSQFIPQILSSMSFPKMMRWGTGSLRFSRPIRNIFCLFGGQPLSFQLDGLASTDFVCGHKLHAPQKLRIKSLAEYRAALKESLVIIDQEERKTIILSQIEARLAPLKAQLYPDPELLHKLSNDVEYPHVFMGSFPEDYLNLPLEILSTAMREGQKLFSVVKEKKQIPFFLGVADAPGDAKGFIQKGNERVLKARLEDAKFFWEQDLKISLKKRAPSLKHVLFQEKLGSYDDKVQRLKKIVAYLCEKAEAKKVEKDAVGAAELCKVDLATDMVREFPSLQGKVGGLYARAEGLPEAVAQAIYEHYQPQSLDDESPSSLPGALLSMADKLDSIVGVMGIGIQTTGSSDPFGLRRNAHGVCKIILDLPLNISFTRLLDKVIMTYGDKLKRPKKEIVAYCRDFFINRLRYIFEKRGFRYDLVNAALNAGIDNIYYTGLRLKALDTLESSPQFEPLILMAKRVNNIITGQPAFAVNTGLFAEKEERELYSIFSIIKQNITPMVAKGDFAQAQKIIFRLQLCLNNFFDHVLVMAEDNKLRRNRLALLQAISKVLLHMADYSQVVVEGEKPAVRK